MNIKFASVLAKINNNLFLLNHDQLEMVKSIKGKTKLNMDHYTKIYDIYRFINHKLIIEQAKSMRSTTKSIKTKRNNAKN